MGAPLLAMIQAWKLEDIQQLLIRHGVINLERLKEITPEDVPELGIPFAPAKVFRRLLQHLDPQKKDGNQLGADAEQSAEKEKERDSHDGSHSQAGAGRENPSKDDLSLIGDTASNSLEDEMKKMIESVPDRTRELGGLLELLKGEISGLLDPKKPKSGGDRSAVSSFDCNVGDVLRVLEDQTMVDEAFEDSDARFTSGMHEYLGRTGVVQDVDAESVKLEHDDDTTLWWAYGAVVLETRGGDYLGAAAKPKKVKKAQWEKVFERYSSSAEAAYPT